MNVLSLVFSVMLIISYGYYAVWEKNIAGRRLRTTYTAHNQANRTILNKFESKIYNSLGSKKAKSPNSGKKGEKKRTGKKKKAPEFNRGCARINLWPLIQEGKENHAQLYELSAKLIRTFYAPITPNEKRFEYHILDVLIASAKEAIQENEDLFSLEKIELLDPDLKRIYYKMLKGTKKWDLRQNIGYPPLLDYVKAERSEEKICIFHSHPDMLTLLFNSELAWKLHEEIHKDQGAVLSRELIEHLASELHMIRLDSDIFQIVTLKEYYSHEDKKKIITAGQGEVLLRKNLSLKN